MTWNKVGNIKGTPGQPGPASIIPGPQGPRGLDSQVPGPAGKDGKDSTVPGPKGADSTVPGPTGQPGVAATIAVGTVTTGAPGSSVSVVNSGTSSAAVFDITIPRGGVGQTGPVGPSYSATKIVTGSCTIGAILLAGTFERTVTAVGLTTADQVYLQPNQAIPTGVGVLHWRVTAAGVITITFIATGIISLNNTPLFFTATKL